MRDATGHARAPTFLRFHLKRPTDGIRAILHHERSEAAPGPAFALSIIVHRQHDRPVAALQTNRGLAGLGVLHGIRQRFLRDAI